MHCGVKLELNPTWKDGKVWEYKSTNTADPPQVSKVFEVPSLVPTLSVQHHLLKTSPYLPPKWKQSARKWNPYLQ